jgi:hypothetical protein
MQRLYGMTWRMLANCIVPWRMKCLSYKNDVSSSRVAKTQEELEARKLRPGSVEVNKEARALQHCRLQPKKTLKRLLLCSEPSRSP